MKTNLELYDVAIVGGGLGGLTAGALLARNGFKVILVEQHRVVGGAATVFKRGDRTFEVGLHEMGSVGTERRQHMFKEMGVWEKVEFVRVPEFYRVRRGDMDITIPDDIDEAREELKRVFPGEINSINQYFEDLVKVRHEGEYIRKPLKKLVLSLPILPFKIPKLIKYRNQNLGDYMDKLTDNEDLKLALIANLGYYHDDPYSLSLLLFLMAQNSYMYGGGWFIKGGSQQLSDALAEVIEENGGKVVVRHLVDEILERENSVYGIRYSSKKGRDKTIYEVHSQHVILNAPVTTLNKLMANYKNTEADLHVKSLVKPCSLFTVYLAFKEPISDMFDNKYSNFFYDESVKTLRDLAAMEKTDNYKQKGFVIVDYNALDSGLCSAGNYVASICGIDYMHYWKDLDEEEYEERKSSVIDTFIGRLEELDPDIRDKIAHAEMSTPKTIQKFTMNPNGVIYGFAQTPKQAFRNKTKKITKQYKNLYVASAYVMVGGFGGSISTGYSVGRKIIKKRKKGVRS